MNLGAPVELRVVRERPDGSGGVIEIPILSTGTIDTGLTAGGGNTKHEIGVEVLGQIAENFTRYQKPVPVGFLGHGEDRSGPQPVFVDGLSVRGGRLYATLDLNAYAFGLVVRERSYRGFSVEISRDLKTATGEFQGWVLTGGIFTNRPAADVNFRIAAEGQGDSRAETAIATTYFRLEGGGEKGQHMSETTAPVGEKKAETVSLEFHQGKLTAAQAEIDGLKAKVSSLEARLSAVPDVAAIKAGLESKLQAAEVERDTQRSLAQRNELQLKATQQAKQALDVQVVELSQKLREQENANLSVKVEQIVTEAIAAGVPPALFDGHKANPAEWMQANYASLEAFERNVATFRGVGKLGLSDRKPVASGHDPATPAEPQGTKLEAKDEAVLQKLGLNVDFGGVTSIEDARAKFEAAKAAKK